MASGNSGAGPSGGSRKPSKKSPPRTRGGLAARARVSVLSRRIVLPLQSYIHAEQAGGMMLILGAIAALIWANSPWGDSYFHFWETELHLDLTVIEISQSLKHWVNDGLMTFFFLLIGVEVKRELVHGELSSWKKAALPAAAAAGGIVLPAGIYFAFNLGGATHGWGVPIATDIAFALGVLGLLGRRAPAALKIFLLAFATADDIAGVLVIAFFYTTDFSLPALLVAFAVLGIIAVLRKLVIRSEGVIWVLGACLWFAVFKSGVHATLAGVALGLLTPARRFIEPRECAEVVGGLKHELDEAIEMRDEDRTDAILGRIEELSLSTEQPTNRIERSLRPWSSYLVLPVFALANAGVVLSLDQIASALTSPVGLGIALGLLVGKFVGVAGASWAIVKWGPAELPESVNWRHLLGASILAGIGFTVSLFISELAFGGDEHADAARLAILLASVIAAVGGYLFLRLAPDETQDGDETTSEEHGISHEEIP